MSKGNSIRKKALEYAKNREWEKALREYVKLAEIEQRNPNVFNELGDLHLKMGNKIEAFNAFHSAIDAYSRVSLFNNAVAVCKKIIRLNPADRGVYGKLAKLRNHQGFKKEAVTYAVSFLERIAHDERIDPESVKTELMELGEEMVHSTEVLERICDCLIKWGYTDEAAKVLGRLADAYAAQGHPELCQETRNRVAALGVALTATPPLAVAAAQRNRGAEIVSDRAKPHGGSKTDRPRPSAPPTEGGPARVFDYGFVDLGGVKVEEEPVATEVVEETGLPDERPEPTKAHRPAAHNPGHGSGTRVDEKAKVHNPQPPSRSPGGERPQKDIDFGFGDEDEAPVSAPPPAQPPKTARTASQEQVWIPDEELPDGLKNVGKPSGDGEVVQMSDIISQFNAEVKADVDVDDYRSHYDLGMAYLEMDLLPEAIREFQFAAKSSHYLARSLEMIGQCFLKQNQPRLAIKQLQKGMQLVGDVDRDSIGLQYNLGLAYEMLGDVVQAKACFEDVYVVDVTFRDVEEKIKKLGQ